MLCSIALPLALAAASTSSPWLELVPGPAVGGLDRPVAIAAAHDGSGRLFVVEQAGRVRVIASTAQGPVLVREPFLDVRHLVGAAHPEQGLLGLAFHPGFARNRKLYLGYTDLRGNNTVAELTADDDGARADTKHLRVLLSIPDFAGNHNGGHVVFGPDGLLHVGTGDGGGAGDPRRTAQSDASQLGKLIALDVDNPAKKPAIKARGLRNPWRYAFDAASGDLYLADVGQDQWEEIDVVTRAELGRASPVLNFGWSMYEGTHCFRAPCDPSGMTMPVFEYGHGEDGCSVTGGVVVDGTFLFGDYCSGRSWMLRRSAAPAGGFEVARGPSLRMPLACIGTDERGGVWLCDHRGSAVPLAVRPVPAVPAVPAATPAR